jgi:hypothetical protein
MASLITVMNVVRVAALLNHKERSVRQLTSNATNVASQISYPQRCPNREKGKTSRNDGSDAGAKSKMAHITIGTVQTAHHRRCSPTISQDILREEASVETEISDVIPDLCAEVM